MRSTSTGATELRGMRQTNSPEENAKLKAKSLSRAKAHLQDLNISIAARILIRAIILSVVKSGYGSSCCLVVVSDMSTRKNRKSCSRSNIDVRKQTTSWLTIMKLKYL